MNFLIDIGNSAIKTAFAGKNNMMLRDVLKLPYEKRNFGKAFETVIDSQLSGTEVLKTGISLLDVSLRQKVAETIAKVSECQVDFIGTDSKLPFKLMYENTIGVDRLCSSAAAFLHSKGRNVLTIDFGTATTYTLIVSGALTGGLIAPGIGTSYNALIRKTTLPETTLSFPGRQFPDNTKENISGGVLYQAFYAMERIISEAIANYGVEFTACTGGFSSMIAGNCKAVDLVDPDLVLKGINLIISQ